MDTDPQRNDGYQGWLCSKQWMSIDESVFGMHPKRAVFARIRGGAPLEDPEEQSLICFGAPLPGFDIDTGKGRIGDRYGYSGAVHRL